MNKITKNDVLKFGFFISGVFIVYLILTTAWQNASEGNYTMLVISSVFLTIIFIMSMVSEKLKEEKYNFNKKKEYQKERLDAIKQYSSLFSWKTRDTLHYMAQDMIDGEEWKISSENKEILSFIGSIVGDCMTRDLNKLSGNPFVQVNTTILHEFEKLKIKELGMLPTIYLVDFYYILLSSNNKKEAINTIKENYQRDLESPKKNVLPPFGKIAIENFTDKPLYGRTEKDPLPEGAEWVIIDK